MPQGDTTASLGWKDNDSIDYTISEAMNQIIKDQNVDYDKMILKSKEGVDLIPSNIELADFELRLVNVISREKILDTCLSPIQKDYDYIIIDSPPSLAMLTINVLSAADKVLIPVSPEYLPAKGMVKLIGTINKVKRQINPKLNVLGIAFTMAKMNTNMAKDTVEAVKNGYGSNFKIFNTIIPSSVRAKEASTNGISIYSHDKDSKVAAAYSDLTKEVIKATKEKLYDQFR